MKNKLTKLQILHLAKLSGLTLDSKEVKSIPPQLQSILEYFESMSKLDTKGVVSTSQTTGLSDIKRSDEIDIDNELKPQEALYNAGETKNNLFKVPLVLKK